MAARDRHEIQVGLALVVAVVVLIAGLLWFQRYQFGVEHQTLQVSFPRAGGLAAGDPVEVRGIPMGKVQSVALSDDGVLVTVDVRRQVTVGPDSRFQIGSSGLLGERMVELDPVGRASVGGDHVFQGTYGLALTDMMGQVEQLNDRLMGLLARVDGVLKDVEESGGLGQVVTETTRAAKAAAEVMEANADDIRTASRSLARAGEKLDRFLTDNEANLNQGAEGLARGTAKLDTLLTQLQEVAQGADHVLTALREQEGAMGKLIYDEQMGQDVGASVEKLKFLIDDILRNPDRYLTVKIF